jgi:hypothetical protein
VFYFIVRFNNRCVKSLKVICNVGLTGYKVTKSDNLKILSHMYSVLMDINSVPQYNSTMIIS